MAIISRLGGGAFGGGGSLRSLGGLNTTQPVSPPVEFAQPSAAMQPPLPPAIWGDGSQVYQGGFGDTSTPISGGVNQTQPIGAPQLLQAPAGASWNSGPIWAGSPQDRLLQTGQQPQGAYQSGNLGQLGASRMPAPSWWQSPRGR